MNLNPTITIIVAKVIIIRKSNDKKAQILKFERFGLKIKNSMKKVNKMNVNVCQYVSCLFTI